MKNLLNNGTKLKEIWWNGMTRGSKRLYLPYLTIQCFLGFFPTQRVKKEENKRHKTKKKMTHDFQSINMQHQA